MQSFITPLFSSLSQREITAIPRASKRYHITVTAGATESNTPVTSSLSFGKYKREITCVKKIKMHLKLLWG
jgi:hypothetical protein